MSAPSTRLEELVAEAQKHLEAGDRLRRLTRDLLCPLLHATSPFRPPRPDPRPGHGL